MKLVAILIRQIIILSYIAIEIVVIIKKMVMILIMIIAIIILLMMITFLFVHSCHITSYFSSFRTSRGG